MMAENSRVRLLVIYRHVHLLLSCLPHSSPSSLICRTYSNFFPLFFLPHIYSKMVQANITHNITLREMQHQPTYYIIQKNGKFRRLFNFSFASSFLRRQSPKANIWLFKYTVALRLSGLIGTASHPDTQKLRIIVFFFESRLLWLFEFRLLLFTVRTCI
jgi:hypothetical protein